MKLEFVRYELGAPKYSSPMEASIHDGTYSAPLKAWLRLYIKQKNGSFKEIKEAKEQDITLCDLQGMLDEFVKKIYGEGTKTRLRPSYFPFTEPSVEVDCSCFECGGKGCKLCKGTGWIEILGAGIVNKKVLEGCGIDPEVYSGYAFGMGIERIVMCKYGIDDMRMLSLR